MKQLAHDTSKMETDERLLFLIVQFRSDLNFLSDLEKQTYYDTWVDICLKDFLSEIKEFGTYLDNNNEADQELRRSLIDELLYDTMWGFLKDEPEELYDKLYNKTKTYLLEAHDNHLHRLHIAKKNKPDTAAALQRINDLKYEIPEIESKLERAEIKGLDVSIDKHKLKRLKEVFDCQIDYFRNKLLLHSLATSSRSNESEMSTNIFKHIIPAIGLAHYYLSISNKDLVISNPEKGKDLAEKYFPKYGNRQPSKTTGQKIQSAFKKFNSITDRISVSGNTKSVDARYETFKEAIIIIEDRQCLLAKEELTKDLNRFIKEYRPSKAV